jgi:hypothetical protein
MSNNLPEFPDSKLLVLEDEEIVTAFTSKYGAYSDFNFVSLWSYNTSEDVEIAAYKGNLIIKFRDYLSNCHFYSFLGTNAISETVNLLMRCSLNIGLKSELKLIPEKVVIEDESLADRFTIIEDRDNFDYLLSVYELSGLLGSRYEKQRKEISRFFRAYPDAQVKNVDITDEINKEAILKLFSIWEEKKQKNREETLSELIAIKRTLRDCDFLSLLVLGLYRDREMIGFVICDLLSSQVAESHFLKYNPEYSGIKHILHHELAKILQAKRYKFINLEQDFGIEDLRKAKESCRPVSYLKKIIIRRKF